MSTEKASVVNYTKEKTKSQFSLIQAKTKVKISRQYIRGESEALPLKKPRFNNEYTVIKVTNRKITPY